MGARVLMLNNHLDVSLKEWVNMFLLEAALGHIQGLADARNFLTSGHGPEISEFQQL